MYGVVMECGAMSAIGTTSFVDGSSVCLKTQKDTGVNTAAATAAVAEDTIAKK